jgi:hypothetical protein
MFSCCLLLKCSKSLALSSKLLALHLNEALLVAYGLHELSHLRNPPVVFLTFATTWGLLLLRLDAS